MQRFLRFSQLFVLVSAWALLPAIGSAQRSHSVRSGETLSAIAARHRISVQDLLAVNNLRANHSLRPGQELRLPERGAVYVRRGDSLSVIARRNRCSIQDLARANRMGVSSTLRIGQRLFLPGRVPEYTPREWGEPEEPGVVTLARGDRRERLRLVDEEGHVVGEGLVALSALLGQEEGGEGDLADARLAFLLASLSDAFGGRPILIVSGFREAQGYTRETSRHVGRAAADIRVIGVPHRSLWERCRRIEGAGCGFYPNSTFVHVDVRDRRAQWVDWSGPGQRPRYGTLSGPTRGNRSMAFPSVDGSVPAEVTVIGLPEAAPTTDSLVASVATPAGDSQLDAASSSGAAVVRTGVSSSTPRSGVIPSFGEESLGRAKSPLE